MAKKKAAAKIEALRHHDKRANIPTEELRDFVADDELAPRTMLYARDPSLDPQLVWRGKDEQDREELAVPVVPIYIQEKIQPRAIVDALPRAAAADEPQLSLFADFNGLPDDFDQRVDFYHHEGNWQNRLILGDSLLVMTSLAEKEGLKGKVQTVYLDPPYGIKFGSNWQVSTRKRDVKDGKAEDATRQPEQIRAFRDTWQLGIHSYLAYLRDRLVVARDLLTESGSVFVQIGDENVHLVRCLMDEVFGAENQVATITFQKTGSTDQALVPQTVDYLLMFAKDIEQVKYRQLYQERARGTLALERYDSVLEPDGRLRRLTKDEVASGEISGLGVRARLTSLLSARPLGSGDLRRFEVNGVAYTPGSGTFKTDRPGMERLLAAGRLRVSGSTLQYLRTVNDFSVVPLHDRWESVQLGTGLTYVVQTSTKVIERAILMTTDPGDLVLDPTCGSGTTAYVAEQWGRRWITCDTSRVALALARTRLMAAKYPYYLLADTPEGRKKLLECGDSSPLSSAAGGRGQEDEGERATSYTYKGGDKSPQSKTDQSGDKSPQSKADQSGDKSPQSKADQSGDESPHSKTPDVHKGFVYKRVPHVTLKSIANNPDIREGMTRAEIDAAIARHAETETLYDQPYEDAKRVRVCGPFTVESLSPHRTVSADEKKQRSEQGLGGLRLKVIGPDSFGTMILDNLRKAGVQNTRRAERLVFDTLEPYAGEWIQGQGSYTEADGTVRRAAISLGPEHGTVGATLIKEAAKEAVRGVGFDILIVCGFAFDPSVSEEAKRYGKLIVLPTKMNPDLAMGDELLKKTGAGNLFMVFGEPDVEIRPASAAEPRAKKARKAGAEPQAAAGALVVEVKGLDVYDPTTGQIRGSSTDDIACWFIDTEYNGESFFVRHAYFTGAEEPYEKLKRALRAEIDEAAWSSLYSTVSRPFPRPGCGKIAVKVINHYGDEVLKVFDV